MRNGRGSATIAILQYLVLAMVFVFFFASAANARTR